MGRKIKSLAKPIEFPQISTLPSFKAMIKAAFKMVPRNTSPSSSRMAMDRDN